jgi:hypothetical protein
VPRGVGQTCAHGRPGPAIAVTPRFEAMPHDVETKYESRSGCVQTSAGSSFERQSATKMWCGTSERHPRVRDDARYLCDG